MGSDGGNEGPDDAPDADHDQPASRVASLSLDSTLELLSDYDRRCLLGYLRDDPDGTATVEELVDHLADKRAKRTDDAPDIDRIETRLHHTHIPKLANAGVIEYDDRSGEIRYWGEDRLEAWHDRIRNRDGH